MANLAGRQTRISLPGETQMMRSAGVSKRQIPRLATQLLPICRRRQRSRSLASKGVVMVPLLRSK